MNGKETMMETLGELERPHIVTYALIELLNIAISRLVAVEAYQEAVKSHGLHAEKDSWFSIAFEAILECLVLDIASLLDKGKIQIRKTVSTNCNFKELKYVLENTENGPVRFHGIIDRIDALCDANKDLLPDKLRHKRIAHKDLDELFNHDTTSVIELARMKAFLMEGRCITSDLMEMLVGARLKPYDFEAVKQSQIASILRPDQ